MKIVVISKVKSVEERFATFTHKNGSCDKISVGYFITLDDFWSAWFCGTEPPGLVAVDAGRYLGVRDSEPVSPRDGDLWIVRVAFPTQRLAMKCRDKDVTRTLQTLVL